MLKEFNLQFFAEEADEEEKTFTQEDIDRIIQNRLAQAQKKADADKQKAIEDALAKENEKLQAQKLKEMSDAERQAEELKELKAQLEELKLKDERATMGAEVRKQLADKQITVSDAIVNMLVAKDAETTNGRLKDFTELFLQAVDDGIKAKLKGKTPAAADKPASMTKTELQEKLAKIDDPIKRQELIRQNLNLYQ